MTPSPSPDSRSGYGRKVLQKGERLKVTFLNTFREVIEACFPGDDEDLVFERESAIAFIQAMHDAARIAAERAALERAAAQLRKGRGYKVFSRYPEVMDFIEWTEKEILALLPAGESQEPKR